MPLDRNDVRTAAALAVEFLACVVLYTASDQLAVGVAACLHVAASIGVAHAVIEWLDAQRIDTTDAFWLIFILAASIPLFAPIGLICALRLGLKYAFFEQTITIEETSSPRLPHRPPELERNLKFATGGLGDILKHSGDVAKRVLAVTAASRMSERDAMPFLKMAMSDPADEVRLLAFSVKDKIETAINDKIKLNLSKLSDVAETDRATVHRALAFLYWELVYLDIAEGDLRLFMLKESDEHAEQCLERSNESSLHTLRGRISLALMKPELAESHFRAAVEAGAESGTVATYRAEAAYLQDDFPAVCRHLEELPMHLRATAPYHALCRVWGLV